MERRIDPLSRSSPVRIGSAPGAADTDRKSRLLANACQGATSDDVCNGCINRSGWSGSWKILGTGRAASESTGNEFRSECDRPTHRLHPVILCATAPFFQRSDESIRPTAADRVVCRIPLRGCEIIYSRRSLQRPQHPQVDHVPVFARLLVGSFLGLQITGQLPQQRIGKEIPEGVQADLTTSDVLVSINAAA